MAKEFTDKELMQLGRELKEAKAKIMFKWGFSDNEIAAVTGMPETELKRVLHSGKFVWDEYSSENTAE